MEGRVVCTVGDLVEDVVVSAAVPLVRGADVPASISYHRGGSAANVAVVAARLGARARFVGRIGGDAVGDRLLGQMRAAGVECVGPRGGPSGTVVVVVEPGGERTMFSDRRSAGDLDRNDDTWLDGVGALHVPYYALLRDPLAGITRNLLAAARRGGAYVSIDPSSVALLDDRFTQVLRTVQPDVVLCNEDEAAALGVDGHGLPDARLVVVKRGADPALLRGAVTATVPAPTLDPLDTTGAGDAFAGGFLAAIVKGADPAAAAAAGHEAASHVVRGVGADAWVE